MAERDPIKLLGEWIIAQELADKAHLDGIYAQIKSEIDAAARFAIQAPYPDVDQVGEDVYA